MKEIWIWIEVMDIKQDTSYYFMFYRNIRDVEMDFI